MFTSPGGTPLHHSDLRRRVWLPALTSAGLHGSDERQHQIADTLSQLASEELKRGSKPQSGQSARRSGTQRARNRKLAS
ncbi:MAG TPA: hypothetical protein VH480_28655 [Streptosporangiaceae bacterium]